MSELSLEYRDDDPNNEALLTGEVKRLTSAAMRATTFFWGNTVEDPATRERVVNIVQPLSVDKCTEFLEAWDTLESPGFDSNYNGFRPLDTFGASREFQLTFHSIIQQTVAEARQAADQIS